MDHTHDPRRRSFVEVPPDGHFPIQNLPYGVFATADDDRPRAGVAIGDYVLDLRALGEAGGLDALPAATKQALMAESLGPFMALGRPAWIDARRALSRLLDRDEPLLRDDAGLRRRVLRERSTAAMRLPAAIGDYTDFYSSRDHAANVGAMFRGTDNALMPNWLWLPVAYHGRASTVVIDGTDVVRPRGQIKRPGAEAPDVGPTERLDFELELGVLIGPPSERGVPVRCDEALEHVFGLVLVNDWSARDIQQWEYQPLGPFVAKNFATSISPWVVTLEALEFARVAAPPQDPEPLSYLRRAVDCAYDIHLEVAMQTAAAQVSTRVCATNARRLYWDMCQQIAHHTVGGCDLRTGDLLASGTISGPDADARGSLLEITWGGDRPLRLPGGETRTFVEDGDRVTLTGWAQGDGYRVGFGECTGRVLPSPAAVQR